MAQKPSIPKGTRDFSPEEMSKRNYIFDTIKEIFQRFGYLPIETPAMENLSTLLGKYGEEGDKLLFKILNSGDAFKTIKEKFPNHSIAGFDFPLSYFCEKGLRYDLTVPFARYVVQHQNEITLPFKRYQIQPVWRADRPQKGRYREFYQCDADVIGSPSLINEIELIQMIDAVFHKLKLPVTIKINNRKILSGIAEVIGQKEKITDITVAIDKLDKIGLEGVIKELQEKNISKDAIEKLKPLMHFNGNNQEKINYLKSLLNTSDIGCKGIEEIEYIFTLQEQLTPFGALLEFDITLARGLNYYTGAIFEVKARSGTMGSSICGGGRYDDLTGIFGLAGVSGVGISFGADRIYDVLNELNLFPGNLSSPTKVLIVCFGKEEQLYALPLLTALRNSGINTEIYPDSDAKLKKQMSYADNKKIPYVVLIGSDEMQNNLFTLKNMQTGEQEKISKEKLIEYLKS
jgi:histidyl-tRNA synthetase